MQFKDYKGTTEAMKYTINYTEHITETEMETSNKRASNDGIDMNK